MVAAHLGGPERADCTDQQRRGGEESADDAGLAGGFGDGGRLISPGDDLPPTPWDAIPILHYEAAAERARLVERLARDAARPELQAAE